MKIRMSRNHNVIEEVIEGRKRIQLDEPGSYITGWTQRGERDGVVKFFSNLDWEPVPDEWWEDVTGDCGITSENYISHGSLFNGRDKLIQTRGDYRFVKKSLWECLPIQIRGCLDTIAMNVHFPGAVAEIKDVHVLKVERKVSA